MLSPGNALRPSSIKVFLADGRPDGLRLVEKSNWTGLALVCARPDYSRVRTREEWARPGVYLLTAPALDAGLRHQLYVGEADDVQSRVDSHLREKDFWTSVIAFTSKDDNLNKAHVRYLEARLLQIAKEADRAALLNGNGPGVPRLSEADQADMEGYLEEMLVILPLLGVMAFEALENQAQPQDQLRLTGRDAEATGADTPDGFVVFEGSLARATSVPSIHGYLTDLREKLISDGVLLPEGPNLRFSKPYAFDSPSTAAGVVLGRAANGRVEWKDAEGVTLKQRQIAALAEPVPD